MPVCVCERESVLVCMCVCVCVCVCVEERFNAIKSLSLCSKYLDNEPVACVRWRDETSDSSEGVCRSSATTLYLCSPCAISRIIVTFLIYKQSYRSYHTQMNKFYNITRLFHQKLLQMFLVRCHSMLHIVCYIHVSLQSVVALTTQKLSIHS